MKHFALKWLSALLFASLLVSVMGTGLAGHAVANAASDEWPMFRRSNLRDASSDSPLSMPLVKQGVFDIGTATNTSPVVAGGRLFLGGEDKALHCLDSSTGQRLWTFDTGGAVRGSAAVDGGRVFVGSDDDCMYCLDAATGTMLWKFKTGSRVESSPAIGDTLVYFGSFDGSIYAVQKETGVQEWSFATGGQVVAAPALYGSMLLVGSQDGTLYALDALKGVKLWSRKLTNNLLNVEDWLYANPAVDAATSSVAVASYDHDLYVLDSLHGGADVGIVRDLGGLLYNGPVVVPNGLVQAWDRGIGYWNSSTGALVWSYRTEAEYRSAPVVANGYVYIIEEAGRINVFELATGENVWWYTVDGSPGRCTPIIAQRNVYFTTSSGRIYVFSDGKAVATPQLAVRPERIDFGAMDAGQNATQYVYVSNANKEVATGLAIGTLQGVVGTDVSWLNLPVSVISANEQTIEVRTDTSELVPGRSYSGHINVVTNGGTSVIPVSVEIRSVPVIVVKLVIGSSTALVNGLPVTLDQAPLIIQGRTLVPVRFISEAFGGTVSWDAATKTIGIVRKGRHLVLQVGNKEASIDGDVVALDVPPSIIGGRTLVPVRFISEAFGATVAWDGPTQEITLTFVP